MEDKKKENCECEEEVCVCDKQQDVVNEEHEKPHLHEEHIKQKEMKHKKAESHQNELIDSLKEEIDKLKNDYAKAYADTENMRKRLQSEFEQSKKYRIQSFALDVLPAIDNLERALQTPPTEETEGYRKGVEMIYNQLLDALHKEGVEEIEANGLPFDANFHQALMAEHVEGIEPGMVVEVLQKGYKLKDRILRASMVKVSD